MQICWKYFMVYEVKRFDFGKISVSWKFVTKGMYCISENIWILNMTFCIIGALNVLKSLICKTNSRVSSTANYSFRFSFKSSFCWYPCWMDYWTKRNHWESWASFTGLIYFENKRFNGVFYSFWFSSNWCILLKWQQGAHFRWTDRRVDARPEKYTTSHDKITFLFARKVNMEDSL